ncbi:MAG: LysR family transcriptional regulator [Clostridiales bacterium]|nr:LysR family transcriptional regulator [Clostridiales bacterium]MDY4182495.1 LysR family transcriptional regulator [Pseudoflavonifractor sp.]
MRLEYLQYLIEIDRCRSISKAAQNLYIGQTTLSSIVKNLEEEFGFSIFHRVHSGVVTTPEGEEALSLAWEILSRYEEIKLLSSTNAARAQAVHVITSPTISCALALPLNHRFLAGEINGTLVFHETTGSEVGAALIQNEINIGLTYFMPGTQAEYEVSAAKYQVEVKPLFRDHLYLLAPADHPLAARDSVALEEIQGVELALLSHFLTDETSLVFSNSVQSANRCTTFSSIPLVKRAIVELHMLGFLTGYAIHYDNSVDPGRIKPIRLTGMRGKNDIDLCLLHHNNSQLCYQERAVIKCIEQYFAELPSPPFSPEAKQQPTG